MDDTADDPLCLQTITASCSSPCTGGGSGSLPTVTVESEFNNNVYEVEKITRMCLVQNKLWFRVRWKGYGKEMDTWEPRENLDCCKELLDAYVSKVKGKKYKQKKRRKVQRALLEQEQHSSNGGILQDGVALNGHVRKKRQKKSRTGEGNGRTYFTRDVQPKWRIHRGQVELIEHDPVTVSPIKEVKTGNGAAKVQGQNASTKHRISTLSLPHGFTKEEHKMDTGSKAEGNGGSVERVKENKSTNKRKEHGVLDTCEDRKSESGEGRSLNLGLQRTAGGERKVSRGRKRKGEQIVKEHRTKKRRKEAYDGQGRQPKVNIWKNGCAKKFISKARRRSRPRVDDGSSDASENHHSEMGRIKLKRLVIRELRSLEALMEFQRMIGGEVRQEQELSDTAEDEDDDVGDAKYELHEVTTMERQDKFLIRIRRKRVMPVLEKEQEECRVDQEKNSLEDTGDDREGGNHGSNKPDEDTSDDIDCGNHGNEPDEDVMKYCGSIEGDAKNEEVEEGGEDNAGEENGLADEEERNDASPKHELVGKYQRMGSGAHLEMLREEALLSDEDSDTDCFLPDISDEESETDMMDEGGSKVSKEEKAAEKVEDIEEEPKGIEKENADLEETKGELQETEALEKKSELNKEKEELEKEGIKEEMEEVAEEVEVQKKEKEELKEKEPVEKKEDVEDERMEVEKEEQKEEESDKEKLEGKKELEDSKRKVEDDRMEREKKKVELEEEKAVETEEESEKEKMEEEKDKLEEVEDEKMELKAEVLEKEKEPEKEKVEEEKEELEEKEEEVKDERMELEKEESEKETMELEDEKEDLKKAEEEKLEEKKETEDDRMELEKEEPEKKEVELKDEKEELEKKYEEKNELEEKKEEVEDAKMEKEEEQEKKMELEEEKEEQKKMTEGTREENEKLEKEKEPEKEKEKSEKELVERKEEVEDDRMEIEEEEQKKEKVELEEEKEASEKEREKLEKKEGVQDERMELEKEKEQETKMDIEEGKEEPQEAKDKLEKGKNELEEIKENVGKEKERIDDKREEQEQAKEVPEKEEESEKKEEKKESEELDVTAAQKRERNQVGSADESQLEGVFTEDVKEHSPMTTDEKDQESKMEVDEQDEPEILKASTQEGGEARKCCDEGSTDDKSRQIEQEIGHDGAEETIREGHVGRAEECKESQCKESKGGENTPKTTIASSEEVDEGNKEECKMNGGESSQDVYHEIAGDAVQVSEMAGGKLCKVQKVDQNKETATIEKTCSSGTDEESMDVETGEDRTVTGTQGEENMDVTDAVVTKADTHPSQDSERDVQTAAQISVPESAGNLHGEKTPAKECDDRNIFESLRCGSQSMFKSGARDVTMEEGESQSVTTATEESSDQGVDTSQSKGTSGEVENVVNTAVTAASEEDPSSSDPVELDIVLKLNGELSNILGSMAVEGSICKNEHSSHDTKEFVEGKDVEDSSPATSHKTGAKEAVSKSNVEQKELPARKAYDSSTSKKNAGSVKATPTYNAAPKRAKDPATQRSKEYSDCKQLANFSTTRREEKDQCPETKVEVGKGSKFARVDQSGTALQKGSVVNGVTEGRKNEGIVKGGERYGTGRERAPKEGMKGVEKPDARQKPEKKEGGSKIPVKKFEKVSGNNAMERVREGWKKFCVEKLSATDEVAKHPEQRSPAGDEQKPVSKHGSGRVETDNKLPQKKTERVPANRGTEGRDGRRTQKGGLKSEAGSDERQRGGVKDGQKTLAKPPSERKAPDGSDPPKKSDGTKKSDAAQNKPKKVEGDPSGATRSSPGSDELYQGLQRFLKSGLTIAKVGYLRRFLESTHEECQIETCTTLTRFMDSNDAKISRVVQTGFCPRLVELLGSPSLDVVSAALLSVSHIVSGNEEQTQAVLACSPLPKFTRLLDRDRFTSAVRKEACLALSNITAGTSQQIQSLIDAGLIPVLLDTMEQDHFYVQYEATWAVANATVNGRPEQIRYIVEQGFFRAFCAALKHSNEVLVQIALDAIHNVLKLERGSRNGQRGQGQYCLLVRKYGGLRLINNARSKGPNFVRKKAENILLTFFKDYL
ncbi:uncharacterized protein [Diadema setosum]|uniref:uncharacterized protein n=1 Tax=Diadema setosum TaxID=31175 RepID=UPI003B3B92B1